jgi:hypothetical protein
MKHARDDYNRMQDPDGKIPADEPVFLIRGQDTVGADTVRAWADLNERAGGDLKASMLARHHAALMDAWPTKKRCDLPREG